MSIRKRLWVAITAFMYLRLYEFLFGYFLLAGIIISTNSIIVPPDWQGVSRLTFALEAPFGILLIYYLLFGYLFASLIIILSLWFMPFFGKVSLAVVNALIYAGHSLWVIHFTLHFLPGSVWAVWLALIVLNALSPSFLPRRLFDETSRAQS